MTPERRAELKAIAKENLNRGYGKVAVLGSAELMDLLLYVDEIEILDPPAKPSE